MTGDIEEIKNRLNIVDVLGEYIRLEKTGTNYRALCPFHNEKSPSFMVSEEKQIWHCFGCQKGGDIFGFVMEIEGLEFRDALKSLADKAGVQLQNYNPKKAEEKNRTLEILELATKFYEYQLWEGPGKTKILNYLRERGLKDETIKEFRLGYAPKGWRHIVQLLEKRGYKLDEIRKTGLIVEKKDAQISNFQFPISNKIPNPNDQNTKYKIPTTNYYDRFRERIMFPIADYSGKILGFSARVAPGGDESQAKYVNTPETEVYHKSRVLYGVDKAKSEIRQKDFVLLVEGNMDVIAASQAGIKNVVAVSGTALTEDQIKIIKRYTPKIKMFFDMDSAGEMATKKSVKLCFQNGMDVQVVTLPQGKDAADLAREDEKKLLDAVDNSKNAVEYFFENNFEKFDKNKVEGKKNITENILEVIGNIASGIEKSHWIKKLAQELEIAESALTDMLKKTTLIGRRGKEEKGVQKAANLDKREKIEILLDDFFGLILSSAGIWEEAGKEKEIFLPLKDRLLNLALEKGQEFKYDFEQFNNFLENQEDKNRLDQLYFQKKYRMDLNGNLEEVEITSPKEEFILVKKEILCELKKKELKRITKDLRLAEEAKDNEARKLLQMEFKKISNELAILLQD